MRRRNYYRQRRPANASSVLVIRRQQKLSKGGTIVGTGFLLLLLIAGIVDARGAGGQSAQGGTKVGHLGTKLRYQGIDYTPIAVAISKGTGDNTPCQADDVFLRVTFRLHNSSRSKALEILSSPFEALSYGREITEGDTCDAPPAWAGNTLEADEWLPPGRTETVTVVREIFRGDRHPQIIAYGDADLNENTVHWRLHV